MKVLLIIAEVLLGLFILSQLVMAGLTLKTEVQPYDVLDSDGNFEIRFYPEARIATVKKPGNYDQASGAGFRSLAGYIFGGNKEEQKIAMTSPVWMESANDSMTMHFVMPESYDLEDLPVPNSSEVQLSETEPIYRAVVRFGGYLSDERIEKKAEELREWLEKKGIKYVDDPQAAGYNAPMQVVGRRNEVAFVLPNYKK